jgi:hypothetical protein
MIKNHLYEKKIICVKFSPICMNEKSYAKIKHIVLKKITQYLC